MVWGRVHGLRKPPSYSPTRDLALPISAWGIGEHSSEAKNLNARWTEALRGHWGRRLGGFAVFWLGGISDASLRSA